MLVRSYVFGVGLAALALTVNEVMLVGRLIVGIGVAAEADTEGEGVGTLLQLFAAGTGLPVTVLIVLPAAHIGVVAGRLVVGIGIAAEADAVLELMSALIHDISAVDTGGPVAVLIIGPVVHVTVLAGGGDRLGQNSASAVIAVLTAVTFAVPRIERIFAENILETTVQPDIIRVIMLTESTGRLRSGYIAGHAEPMRESGTPSPINAT